MAINSPSCPASPAWTQEDTSGPVLTLLPVSLMLTGLTLILLCPLSECGCCCFAGPMNMAAFLYMLIPVSGIQISEDSARPALTIPTVRGTPTDLAPHNGHTAQLLGSLVRSFQQEG